jgi:hypothetical protein
MYDGRLLDEDRRGVQAPDFLRIAGPDADRGFPRLFGLFGLFGIAISLSVWNEIGARPGLQREQIVGSCRGARKRLGSLMGSRKGVRHHVSER